MLEELKKGIVSHYQTSTIYTVDGIKIYQDHVPQSVNYPFIAFYHIASNYSYAMIDVAAGHPAGYDYLNPARIQFSVYVNDRQYSSMEDLADRLEDLFNKQKITLANSCTNFGILTVNSRTKFFDQNQKIWGLHQDYSFWVGR